MRVVVLRVMVKSVFIMMAVMAVMAVTAVFSMMAISGGRGMLVCANYGCWPARS